MTNWEGDFAKWCEDRKAEAQARRAALRLQMRMVRVRDRLPNARVWLHGPRWQRGFNLQHLPIAEVAPESAKYHREGKKFWWYDWTDDVRELVCEPIRFHVYAMWADPRERLR